jgi:hypothetical protein
VEEFSTFLVPDDGADLHSVVAVAIRANDFIRIVFIEVSRLRLGPSPRQALRPESNDLFGRDIIIFVAASTRGVSLVRYMLQPVSDDFLQVGPVV